MKLLTALGLFLLLIAGYVRPITAMSQDLGRHLLTGELIIKTQAVPNVNLFSYTYPEFPFINHHWLSEVVFASLYQVTGFPGLFLLMLLLISLAGFFQIRQVFSRVSALTLAISASWYLMILFERTDLRPELFSYAFLSLFIFLLYTYRAKPGPFIFLLPLFQLLWVNMHIYFAIGLIVTGLFLLDAVIVNRKKLMTPPVIKLASVFVLCCLLSLVNPNGLPGLLYPLRVFENYGYSIEENQTMFLLQSLGYHKQSFPYFLSAVFALFILLGASFRKTRPIDWLLAVTFTIIGFMAIRNMPLFVLTTFIPFTLGLEQMIKRLKPYFLNVPVIKTYTAVLVPLCILFLFIRTGTSIASAHPIEYGVTPGAEKAVDFLIREQITGRLFNNFDIGSYLIYRLYPEQQVFVDGRPEAYPASFFRDVYIPMQEERAVFDEIVKRYGIQTIFFTHTDQTPWGRTFVQSIVTHSDWQLIYLDDTVLMLVKKSPEHKALIDRFGMDRTNLRIEKTEETIDANLRIANFLATVGWIEEGLPVYLDILREEPSFCPAIRLVAESYHRQNNPAAAIYLERYSQDCRELLQ